jgi:hypothetical protein
MRVRAQSLKVSSSPAATRRQTVALDIERALAAPGME